MNALIDDLLSLSRISRNDLEMQTVDLSAIASSVAKELQASQPTRKVQVAVQSDMHLRADPGLMRIVLENLIGNAWKFTGKSESARIDVGSQIQDGKNIYFIQDNGAGFDMEQSKRLFEPFQRLHAKEEFEGTGLGLSIRKSDYCQARRNHMGKICQGIGSYFLLYVLMFPLIVHCTEILFACLLRFQCVDQNGQGCH